MDVVQGDVKQGFMQGELAEGGEYYLSLPKGGLPGVPRAQERAQQCVPVLVLRRLRRRVPLPRARKAPPLPKADCPWFEL